MEKRDIEISGISKGNLLTAPGFIWLLLIRASFWEYTQASSRNGNYMHVKLGGNFIDGKYFFP